MRRALGALLVSALTVAGCGGGAPALSEGAAGDLSARAAQVRAAAVARDRARAAGALAGLRSAVTTHRNQGQVSEERAARILAAAAEVEAQLGLLPEPTTTTTVGRRPTVTTARDQRPPDQDEEQRGGNKGEDRGKGKDDGDD